LHPAQVFVVVSHDGVLPAHASVLVVEHWPQAPVGKQAGALAEGQGKVAPESKSPLQAEHVLLSRLQAGVVAPQPLHPPH
jgi:hypothetical protein